jgi:hypothetical protein
MMHKSAKEIARLLGDDSPTPNGPYGVVTWCPVHGEGKDSKSRSLSITVKTDRLIVFCFSGCNQDEVFKAVIEVAGHGYARADVHKLSRHEHLLAQGFMDTVWYPYLDEKRHLRYEIGRYVDNLGLGRHKTFCPRHKKPNGRYAYKLPGDKRRILYRLPEIVERKDEVVHVTEGEKDADTLAKLGFLSSSFKSAKTTNLEPLRGRHVIVHRDNDPVNEKTRKKSGEGQADDFARAVKGLVASLKLMPDYPIKEGDKKADVTSWIEAGGTRDDLLARIEQAVNFAPLDDDDNLGTGYDGIMVSDKQLDDLTNETWGKVAEANEPPHLFNFGGALVRVHDGTIDELGLADVRYELTSLTKWYKWDARRAMMLPAIPDDRLCQNLLATPAHRMGVPTLRRVSQLPLITLDGRVLTKPGFDAETGIWVNVSGLDGLVMPEAPTRDDAATALAYINEELLHDFPFVSRADRTNCLALFLTMLARQLIDGCVPLFLLDKPEIGTGASLIVETFGKVLFGQDIAASTVPSGEDEWRKRITAFLRKSSDIIWLDNADSALASSSLAAMLTSRVWEDRQLGVNEILRLPIEAVPVVTGNQPTTSKDIARRTVDIRLDAQMEKPFTRKIDAFRHPDLKGWATADRVKLVAAGLTILKAWIDADEPEGKHEPMSSFVEWSRIVGGALALAGADDFLANRDTFYERAVPQADNEKLLIEVWWEAHQEREVFTSQVLDLIEGRGEQECLIDIKLRPGTNGDRQNQVAKLLKHQFKDKRFTIGDERKNGEAIIDVSVIPAGKERRRAQWRLVVHRRTEIRPTMSFEEQCEAMEATFDAAETAA